VAEQYAIHFHVVNVKTGKRASETMIQPLPMSDAELAEPGFIGAKIKTTARAIGKTLATILKKHITPLPSRKTPHAVQKSAALPN